jgi:soluble lytic murein transglycosylase-like protein
MPLAKALWLSTILLCFSTSAGANQTLSRDSVLREKLAQGLAASTLNADQFDAQVWLQISDQRLQPYLPDPATRLQLLYIVYREAAQQSLDPDLILALIEVESAFDPFAISSAGAQGLMQIMPFWRREIGRPQDNLTDMSTNIRYGTVILAHYINTANGDLVDALARYNGSRGALKYPDKVITRWRTTWHNKPMSELPGLLSGCARYPLKACTAEPMRPQVNN